MQSCITDVGEVLSNGTLQVTNSSSVFHSSSVVSMSCSSGEDGQEFSFSVILQGSLVFRLFFPVHITVWLHA